VAATIPKSSKLTHQSVIVFGRSQSFFSFWQKTKGCLEVSLHFIQEFVSAHRSFPLKWRFVISPKENQMGFYKCTALFKWWWPYFDHWLFWCEMSFCKPVESRVSADIIKIKTVIFRVVSTSFQSVLLVIHLSSIIFLVIFGHILTSPIHFVDRPFWP